MELCEPLYLSATIKNPRKLLKKLQKSSLPCHFFVLTLSGGMDQLEIYPASAAAFLPESFSCDCRTGRRL